MNAPQQPGSRDAKTSRFNLYFRSVEPGLHLIYNTFTEAAVLVSRSGLEAVQRNPSAIPPEKRRVLEDAGVVVSADTDELRMFRVNHNRIKYSSSECFIMLYTTYACNLACAYCYETFLTRTKGLRKRMRSDGVSAVVRFVKNLAEETGFRTLRLFFFGGEPLLNPEPIVAALRELTPWAISQDIDISSAICTNGAVAPDRILPSLKDFGTFFHFTLDGPRDVHDRRRPYARRPAASSGTFDVILRNMELVKASGMDFGVRVNLDRDNSPRVVELLQELRSRFGPGLKIRFAEVVPPLGPGADESACPWTRQCLMGSDPGLIISSIQSARDLGFVVLTRPLRDWVFCELLRQHSYIVDPYGDVYKCEGLAGLKAHRAGVLDRNGRLKPTFAYYDWLSHDPLETECRDCVLLPACGGGCPCLTFEEKGTYHAGGCTAFRPLLQAFIRYYLASAFPGLLEA